MSTIEDTLATLVADAYSAGASDLHLVARQAPRVRVDGALTPLGDTPLSPGDLRALAVHLIGETRIGRLEHEARVQRRVTLRVQGSPATLMARATLTRSADAFALSLRFGCQGTPPTVDELGVPQAIVDLLGAPGGLVIVAGPHASGKTSTLHGLVEWINANRSVHVCTIEDPLDRSFEPKQALLQQREVGTDVPDAASGITAALDQDVDVLMIASLTSLESLSATLHAAETGHLVLTQVHANSAEEAIERLIEATPETMHGLVRRTLSQTLRGVLFQRLLPREPRGRVAAYQVLLPDEGLRAAIANGDALSGFGAPGSQSLAEGLERLLAAGEISAEAAAATRASL